MRLKSLFLLDMRFQAKHGFYFLYVVLTVIYAVALLAVPESWKEKTAIILIFSDPASMGLFFMGAIVLLEKSQHTPCAFAVSPVRPMEYIIAKVVTMPPAAAQMMMKAVGFLLLVHICFQFVVSLFWRHQYTTEHVVTPGAPEPGKLSVAAILPAQMIGAFKPVYL